MSHFVQRTHNVCRNSGTFHVLSEDNEQIGDKGAQIAYSQVTEGLTVGDAVISLTKEKQTPTKYYSNTADRHAVLQVDEDFRRVV
jgi:hypothetical protein